MYTVLYHMISYCCVFLSKSIAVLTTTYPLGHLPYGWLNQLRTISPAFGQVRVLNKQIHCYVTRVLTYVHIL